MLVRFNIWDPQLPSMFLTMTVMNTSFCFCKDERKLEKGEQHESSPKWNKSILIAPLVARGQVINPPSSMVADGTWIKLKKVEVHVTTNFLNTGSVISGLCDQNYDFFQ